MLLPGWIYQGNMIIPRNVDTRATYVDGVVTNPNLKMIRDAKRVIEDRTVVQVDGCLSEATRAQLTDLGTFESATYNHACSNQGINKLSSSQQAQLRDLQIQYGCNLTFYDEVRAAHAPTRAATDCSNVPETNPNITFMSNGLEVTRELSCSMAVSIATNKAYCPQLPDECPKKMGKSERKFHDVYRCASDAHLSMLPYRETVVQLIDTGSSETVSVRMPGNVTDAAVAACASAAYMCAAPGQGQCRGAPAFLQLIYPGMLAPCSLTTYPDATASDFAAANGGFAGANGAMNDCINQAVAFCATERLFDVCPGVIEQLRTKDLPYALGDGMGAAEKAELGELVSSVAPLAGCMAAGTCYADLLALAPQTSGGSLANWTYRFDADVDERALSLPTVACAAPGDVGATSAAQCTATRADLDLLLWDDWFKANNSRVEYKFVDRQRGSRFKPLKEGKYQGAYLVQSWSRAALSFAYTVLYNGTIFPGYDDPDGEREQEVGGLSQRLSATVYRGLVGAEPEVLKMNFPTACHAFVPDFTAGASWVFPAVLGFMQVVLTFQIVSEKSSNMRELMTMAGLSRRPYWTITWLYGLMLYTLQVVFVLVVAYAFAFRSIVTHSLGLVFVLLLFYAAQQVSFACFTSTLFGNKWAALVVSFFMHVFIFVFAGWQTADRATGYSTSSTGPQFLLNLVPAFALAHASEILTQCGVGDATLRNTVSLTFANVGSETHHPLSLIIAAMFAGCIFWLALAIYCDCVLRIGPGVKLPPTFPCDALTARRSAATKAERAKAAHEVALGPEPNEVPEVIAERARALEQRGGVRALGLNKAYHGATRSAVVNVQFGIHKGECFGLLGSNGAGKSTTIHMLCGLHPPTHGTVLCGDDELDVRTQLNEIQSSMGVCSQDNLLWDDLTGPEHLRFFGRLRRVAPSQLKHHVDYWLQRVNLHAPFQRGRYSRAYSGGMKRRLGVANAFIGNPQLVYLDEPSTGLDPESRQQLWRAVLAAKPGKCLILTTHALEEAEALCDRVGIMTFGQMRTLGTPTELRLRFDQGYKLMVAVDISDASYEAQAEAFVLSILPRARLVDAINGVRSYLVPKEGVVMSSVFEGMVGECKNHHIKDWGLSHTTLEEVFLQIVQAHGDAAR